jgi:hypothetical protein
MLSMDNGVCDPKAGIAGQVFHNIRLAKLGSLRKAAMTRQVAAEVSEASIF